MKFQRNLLSFFLVALLSTSSFAYTGAKEIVITKGTNKMHIIDYYKVLVVLSITERPFSSSDVECGVFPFDEKRRIGQFGDNVVYFGDKEYGYINNNRKFYAENKLDLTLYKKRCNNFEVRQKK